MEPNERALKRRARRAYELGRLRYAITRVWIVLPLLLAADAVSCALGTSVIVGVALFGTTLFLAWRGGMFDRAIYPATIAGLGTFVAPITCSALGLGGAAMWAACVAGGVGAGLWLAWWTTRHAERPLACLAAGGLHAVLVGTLGCAPLGAGALVGMAAGLAIASVPVALVRSRVAS
jgi:hypothetical protein